MNRAEVTERAKQLVIGSGPSNCLEFTTELIENYAGVKQSEPGFAQVYAEVRKQALRVYRFLGYLAPGEPAEAAR